MLANLFGPAGWNAIATRSRLGQRLNWKNSNFNFQSQRKRNTQTTTTTTNSNKQHICKQAETNQLCSAAPPFKIKRWESQRARERESVRERERVWWTGRRAKSNGDGLILDFSVDAAELKQQLQQQQQRSLSKTRLAKLFCCWKSLRQVAAWKHRTIKNKQIFLWTFQMRTEHEQPENRQQILSCWLHNANT